MKIIAWKLKKFLLSPESAKDNAVLPRKSVFSIISGNVMSQY